MPTPAPGPSSPAIRALLLCDLIASTQLDHAHRATRRYPLIRDIQPTATEPHMAYRPPQCATSEITPETVMARNCAIAAHPGAADICLRRAAHYLTSISAVSHFFMMTKVDLTTPLVYAGVRAALLAWRARPWLSGLIARQQAGREFDA